MADMSYRRRIDMARARRLYAAGWTIQRIADLEGCAASTIYNRFVNERVPIRKQSGGRVAAIRAAWSRIQQRLAQAIEARRAETGTGSVADESAVGNADAPRQ